MKVTHFFFFIYNAIPFLILSILLNKVPLVESSGGAVGGSGHEKIAIEENPNYLDDFSSSSSSSESDFSDHDFSDFDEYDSTDDEDYESKSAINKALSKVNKKASKSIRLIQKKRTIITITLALFAFRREITNLLLHLTTTTTQDGKRRMIAPIRISPTSILKIVLFIDFMRKMQDSGDSGVGGDRSQPIKSSTGIIGLMLRDFLQPSNAAFIPPSVQHYTFEKMNERYVKDGYAWEKATSTSSSSSSSSKISLFDSALSSYITPKNQTNSNNNSNVTTILIEMKLDSSVNSMPMLRDQISFLLHQHRSNMDKLATSLEGERHNTTEHNATSSFVSSSSNSSTSNETLASSLPPLEVVVLLESPGGSATDYGLASNLIGRLSKEPGIKLTICVDKIAASGGYMMACMASEGQLYAAPFAILGSIGVYGQTLNIHNTLQNWGIKPLVFRGGKDKAPVGLVGEITKEGIAKVQDMIDKTHLAFKRHVSDARPNLLADIDTIATGDVWLGHDALKIGLVDRIVTSDEYISEKIYNGEQVLKLIKFQRPRLSFFGNPRYGPGVIQSCFQSVSEFFTDCKVAVGIINGALEGIPTQSKTASLVSATAFGPEITIHKP